jgi:3-dehydroquinate synthase
MPPEKLAINPETSLLLDGFLKNTSYSQIGVLVDSNTKKSCYGHIQNQLPSHCLIEVHAGEEFKTLETCAEVWKQLTEHRFDRHALLIIVGGGVLGDLGGFCAATYKRGIDFILLPTTLLAQVDASIGGKLGIDFLHYKNHIGVFQEPVSTLISSTFLKTLPDRELRSGFAEVIKHCLISDRAMWERIRNQPLKNQDWNTLIKHSAEFKFSVIRQDPKEKGLRKILNFGHTVGHAVESYFLDTPLRLFHGEAIAVGMICEAHIAYKKGLLEKGALDQISGFIIEIFGKVDVPKIQPLISLMAQDKKNKGDKILMALIEGIGKAVWDIDVNQSEAENALSYYESL